jgi:hypothetical protein
VALAVGDVVALVVFTVIGLVNHEDGVTVRGLLEVVGPIVVVGAVGAGAFGTYRRPSIRTLLPTWAVAVPLGILIRKALFHEPARWSSTGVFIVLALAFSLLFLLAWRLLARFVLRSPRGSVASARST